MNLDKSGLEEEIENWKEKYERFKKKKSEQNSGRLLSTKDQQLKVKIQGENVKSPRIELKTNESKPILNLDILNRESKVDKKESKIIFEKREGITYRKKELTRMMEILQVKLEQARNIAITQNKHKSIPLHAIVRVGGQTKSTKEVMNKYPDPCVWNDDIKL